MVLIATFYITQTRTELSKLRFRNHKRNLNTLTALPCGFTNTTGRKGVWSLNFTTLYKEAPFGMPSPKQSSWSSYSIDFSIIRNNQLGHLYAFHHIVVIIKWLFVSQDKINYRYIPTPPSPPPLSPTTSTTITPLLPLLLTLPCCRIIRSYSFPIT
jgi:hypothetical protein